MKRLIPVIVVCMLGGGAGAVAAAMWVNSGTRAEAQAVATHAAADANVAAHSDTSAHDSGLAAATATDSGAPASEHATGQASTDSLAPADAMPPVTTGALVPEGRAATPPAAGVADTAADARVRRLGKLFGQMPAKDAARVLVAMTDADVAAILAHVPDRAASKILAALPPQQAAAVAGWTMPALAVPTPRP
ncbi:MAG TPA: hypothetical protein VFO66_09535 [Gemmatimonadaceae bacterium]|nr:hypothetical protein [Gemmatimonadaceae bacterium]